MWVIISTILWVRIGIILSIIVFGLIIIAPAGMIICTILIIRIVYITGVVTMYHRGMMVIIMPRVSTTISTSTSILGGVDTNNCATETIHDIFIYVMRRGRLEHKMMY